MSNIIWSDYQMQVFKKLAKTDRHLVIQAVAGSGKTSTIIRAIKMMEEKGLCHSMMFLAFNKKIQTHAEGLLKRKRVTKCTARTFNSLGHSMLFGAHIGVRRFDPDKMSKYMDNQFQENASHLLGTVSPDGMKKIKSRVNAACNYIRNMGLLLNTDYDTKQYIQLITENYDRIYENDLANNDRLTEKQIKKLAKLCIVAMQDLESDFETIDFVDQVRMITLYPELFSFRGLPTIVFIDEAQDCGPYQLWFIEKIKQAGKRIIAVGDRLQAIYGFRGADEYAMDKIVSTLGALELPLSITYRCKSYICSHINEQVRESELEPHKVGGEVRIVNVFEGYKGNDDDKQAKGQHAMTKRLEAVLNYEIEMVISSTNFMLFGVYLELFVRSVKCSLKGTGITGRIRSLITQVKGKIKRWDEMIEKCKETLDLGIDVIGSQKYDLISCLLFVIEKLRIRSWAQLEQQLNLIDSQDGKGIQLHTVHSAKGLEAERVAVIDYYFGDQATNLEYVALSRASDLLVVI